MAMMSLQQQFRRFFAWGLSGLLAAALLSPAICLWGASPVQAAPVMAADDHGDHGHPEDILHGDAKPQLEDPSEFRSDKALFTLVVFGLMLLGLYTLAWKPIMEALKRRERTIAESVEAAQRASAEATSKLDEYQRQLSEARQEAQRIVADARQAAEATKERMLVEAKEESARQVERGLQQIEVATQSALAELTSTSTDLAFDLARRVVGREMRPEDHQQLVQEMLGKLPSRN
jgi:F-type H+-transporting ATPase subunit b